AGQPYDVECLALARVAVALDGDCHQGWCPRWLRETVSHADGADCCCTLRIIRLVAAVCADETGVEVFSQHCERRRRGALVGLESLCAWHRRCGSAGANSLAT